MERVRASFSLSSMSLYTEHVYFFSFPFFFFIHLYFKRFPKMTKFEVDYLLVAKTLVCGGRHNSRTMLTKDFFCNNLEKSKNIYSVSLILRSHRFVEMEENKNS